MASGTVGYEDTRGDKSWLGFVAKKLKEYWDGREKKEKEKGGAIVAAGDNNSLTQQITNVFVTVESPTGGGLGNNFFSKGMLRDMNPRNPDVMGPTIANYQPPTTRNMINITDTGEDEVVDVLAVQTEVIDNKLEALIGSVDQVAKIQKAGIDKQISLAQKASARQRSTLEENKLERIKDLSKTIGYKRAGQKGGAAGGGGGGVMGSLLGAAAVGGRAGRLGLGIGVKNLANQVGRRGIRRVGTRAVSAIGGRTGARIARRLGMRFAQKAGKGFLGKTLAKKVPFLGLGLGGLFAIQRLAKGDWGGALLELGSGIASTFPGVGTAISAGLDTALLAKDMMGGEGFRTGGSFITDAPESGGLLGGIGNVHGREKVTIQPLNSGQGKKSAIQQAKWTLQGWKESGTDWAKLQAKGLSQFWNAEGGLSSLGSLFSSMGDGAGNIIEGVTNRVKDAVSAINQNVIQPVREFVQNKAEGVKNWVVEGTQSNIEKVGNFLSNTRDGAVDVFNNAASAINNSGAANFIRQNVLGEEGDGFIGNPAWGIKLPSWLGGGNDQSSVSDSSMSFAQAANLGEQLNLSNLSTDAALGAFSTNAGTVNNFYSTSSSGGENVPTSNEAFPAEGHGNSLSAFSALTLGTL